MKKKRIEKKSFWKRLLADPRGLSTGVKIVGGALAVAGAIASGKVLNQADSTAAKISGAQTVQGTTSAGQ
jgi:hypothetical protein